VDVTLAQVAVFRSLLRDTRCACAKERRGRPAKITPRQLKALLSARKTLQRKHGQQREVTLSLLRTLPQT